VEYLKTQVERINKGFLLRVQEAAGRARTGGAAGQKGRVSSNRALEREEQSRGKDSNTRSSFSIRSNARR